MDYPSKEKTTEKDIIIQVVQDLSKIAQKEFRGGYSDKTFSGNQIVENYITDSRKEYCQLVNFLSDLLLPNFDDETSEKYKEIQDELEKLVEKYNNRKISKEDYMSEKLKLSRQLFQHLSILLNKLNWLRKKGGTG